MLRSAFFAMILLVSTVAVAEAGYPWGGFGYGGGFGGLVVPGVGFGFGNGMAYTPPPPYFAMHPPVYYGTRVIRRAYGTSPFPLPPINGVDASHGSAAGYDEPAPAPLMIINPFVPGAETWVPPSTIPGEALPTPPRVNAVPVPPIPPVPAVLPPPAGK